MSIYDTILVYADRSINNADALCPIAELAEHFGGSILLLNVIEAPTFFYHFGKAELGLPRDPSEMSEEEKAAEYNLEQLAQPLSIKGIDVQCIIIEGTIEEAIVACAREYKASLVVFVGDQPKKIGRLFTVNVREYVSQRINAPVMLMKTAYEHCTWYHG